jgi:CBS domain-containing protein
MARTVRELMCGDPIALDAGRSAREAARRMREQSVGDVLVTKGGALCGIVTDRDIVVRCVAEGEDPDDLKLERICSRELTTIGPDAEVAEAVRLMRQHAIRRIPVVDGKKAVGVLSIGDLALSQDRASALGEISAAPPNV